ncbi:hypothetical protein [Flavobacterium sp. NKUCC04_CG]|uniref:hypothetical protein n=1 Tax=Flavobacterium sp. NKUCC04_CG TaxID=2842121 RepID=UPI001C5ADFFB|nr:hypothetical protein [Flavobacterium sp. NKUCC04_CG]MBW3519511.1 hypothetical protein [Flavobacterium sp. NKUCC04_CG]
MQKENVNATSSQAVMSAAVRYLQDTARLSNFRTLDHDVHELIEVLLMTDFVEEKELRNKVVLLLRHAKYFTQAFEPFSDQEIKNSFADYLQVE